MEALNRLPWVAKSPIFTRLSEIAEVSQLTREERIQYDAALRIYRDNLFALEGAEEVGLKKGLEQGLEQGRAEGRAEGMISAARKMLDNGMDTATIQMILGLSDDEMKLL